MKSSFLGCALAGLFLMAAIFYGCYTNPQTHRSELSLISSSEEVTLGAQSFTDLKNTTPVSHDAATNDQVKRVGQRIASVVNLPGAQWEFVAFDQPNTANAFCLPGGKVGIYTGILPLTHDDFGLATVLAHEVSHAVARHGGERMSQALLVQLGGVGLSVALKDKPAQTQQLALAAYGAGTTVGLMLPFSRQQESEADYMGLLSMAKAGYDPNKAIEFWQRFKAYNDSHGGGSQIAFLSDHPLDAQRIKDLQKHLPEAMAIYQGHR